MFQPRCLAAACATVSAASDKAPIGPRRRGGAADSAALWWQTPERACAKHGRPPPFAGYRRSPPHGRNVGRRSCSVRSRSASWDVDDPALVERLQQHKLNRNRLTHNRTLAPLTITPKKLERPSSQMRQAFKTGPVEFRRGLSAYVRPAGHRHPA